MDSYRLVGRHAGRLFKGEPVAELPVGEPRKFEPDHQPQNRSRALGLTVPPNLLAIADEVIE